jgi:GH15 family glucan-1,4-alpha-glucosidase
MIRADTVGELARPDRDHLIRLGRRSRELIAGLQAASGAYPACPDFSAYRGYAWLRDGSFTAEGMSRAGAAGSADRFHDWVRGVLTDRADRVAAVVAAVRDGRHPSTDRPAGGDSANAAAGLDLSLLLPTRFTLDGRDGSDPWWDFQTDGYGLWLWALTEHARRHGRVIDRWLPGVRVCVDYLNAVGGSACYDWWEEHHEHRHTSTLGAVFAGLVAAAGMEELDADRRAAAGDTAERNRATVQAEAVAPDWSLTKWIGSDAVDGSLPACIVPFGLVPAGSPVATATLDRVEAELSSGEGMHRFAADVFYGGGQWPLLSCLLGWNRAVAGEPDRALAHLRWAARQAERDGQLPEQVPDHLLHPESRREWLDRWGPVARPLLWSHGMYLILAGELGLLEGA